METEIKPGVKRSIENVLFLLKPFWKHGKPLIFLAGISTLVFVVRSVTMVTIAQAIIEAAGSGRGTGHVLAVALTYMAVIVACFAVREARVELYARWKTVHIESNIEREIYEQAMRTDFKFVDDPKYFDKFKMATEEYVSRSYQVFDYVQQIIGDILGGIAILTVMASSEPVAVPIVVVGVVASSFCRMRDNVVTNKIWKDTTIQRRRMNYLTRLLYTKAANLDLRSSNAREGVFKNFDEARDERIGEYKRYRLKKFLYRMVQCTFDDLASYFVMVYIALQLVNGRIESIGVFTTLIAAANALSGNLSRISYYVTEFMNVSLYADNVRGFFELKSNIEPIETGAEPANNTFSIEFDDVCFAYAEQDGTGYILNKLNMKIAPGEKVAIVGENGVGKSTLLKLILRLYDVNSGEIKIDDKPLYDYNVHLLRDRIGVAFQEPVIYALKLSENLQIYRKSDDEKLCGILKKVGLSKLCDGNGLNMDLTREFDEKGVMLSGGEMQKFALARLLVGGFGLLLLDEPTASLDPLAEYELNKLILDRKRPETTIVIAHRLSTIRNADKIFLLENGAVAEQGSHDELMLLCGKYYEMFTKQAENYMN